MNISCEQVWAEYEKMCRYKESIGLYDTVRVNENFFVGRQWEGVVSNGLPTPVFNFLKRVTLFTVASNTSDKITIEAAVRGRERREAYEERAQQINEKLAYIFDENKIPSLVREYMRNAAVDGDAATYSFWDEETGEIKTELIANTRVGFGNPEEKRVQNQPYILITRRERVSNIRKRAADYGNTNPEEILPDETGETGDDARATVILRLHKDESGGIIAAEYCKNAVVRPPWALGLRLYPVTWLCWDYVRDSYHGQALITGLIPNQIYVNKLFAMTLLSLMTTAYPKVVFDKTRVSEWDNGIGRAIGVNGGGVDNVAKLLDPAHVSPQIADFIKLTVEMTQSMLGATGAALGDTIPYNTSAIIALQRASATPSELSKQNLYDSVLELGRIYIDFMKSDDEELNELNLGLRLKVGSSSYWSEIAATQTLDNLLSAGKISVLDYLERIPDDYITDRRGLIESIKLREENIGGLS